MTQTTEASEPTTSLDPRFSDDGATATPWHDGRRILEQAQTYWLSTVRADGRPHVTTVAAVWAEGALHVATGDGEQKRRNLATNPCCVLTTGCNGFEGMDVVVEAEAVEVVEAGQLERVADAFVAKYGEIFRFLVDGSHFRLPESPEGIVRCYRIVARQAFGFAKSHPFSQTRWRFEAAPWKAVPAP
jgi:hypothetical protein